MYWQREGTYINLLNSKAGESDRLVEYALRMKISRLLRSRIFTMIQKSLTLVGLQAIRREKYEMLKTFGFLSLADRWATEEAPPGLKEFVFTNLNKSHAQLQQDLWAIYEFQQRHSSDKGHRFFVEFGATDGILRSNTYLLEKNYGWNGILCEPARRYQASLRNNRNVSIENRCVFSKTGETVKFHEVDASELSGIADFQQVGGWEHERSLFKEYNVETITLNEMLLTHNAPKRINYMSIDTEGSEYEILRDFPFDRWEIETLSIEHNYSENEKKLDTLLSKNGYIRVLKEASCWDAWYVRSSI